MVFSLSRGVSICSFDTAARIRCWITDRYARLYLFYVPWAILLVGVWIVSLYYRRRDEHRDARERLRFLDISLILIWVWVRTLSDMFVIFD